MKRFLFVLLSLPLLAYGLLKFSGLPEIQLFGDLVPRVDTSRKVVALTFDDGPTRAWTDPILQELAQHEVRGTFFLVGEAMARAPELTRRIAEAGHEIGNHLSGVGRFVLARWPFPKNARAGGGRPGRVVIAFDFNFLDK